MKREVPTAEQIAALPIRWDKNGDLRVLMVTSRDRGRWIMPKGWLMDGKKPWNAAKIEALEEAGAVGEISDQPIGAYHYVKRIDRKTRMKCHVTVYPMIVEKLKNRWKEKKQRKRHWFSPKKASKLVEEEELARLLMTLAEGAASSAVLEGLRSRV